RMAYILGDERPVGDGECIFCAFVARGPERHREHLILAAEEHAFVILNKFPYNNGHVMVVPRAHVDEPGKLGPEALAATSTLLTATVARLREALRPDGFNLGMNLGRTAGAGIAEHCHWHVVPRWNGDTNFMPVVGETKVLSEMLGGSYDRL